MKARVAVAALAKVWDAKSVKIYGPYAPSPGRSRWRITLICSDTGAKRSLTVASQAEAEALIPELQRQYATSAGLTIHEVLGQFLEAKRLAGVKEVSISIVSEQLYRFLPNSQIGSFTPANAAQLYIDYTKRIGRYGQIKAATHHHALKRAKELWRFAVEQGLAKTNVFERVKPIGRANCGKPQLRETDAKRLDKALFERAREGNEGALALLVQVYLGLRSSEVLSLTCSDIEREGHKVSIQRGKTVNARRTLELYTEVAALLHKHCKGRPLNERVFAANLDHMPHANWLYKRLRLACKSIGIPLVCPHSLRGLHSSLALEAGATTRHVAAQLGHASFSTTAKHYASPSSVENAANRRFSSALSEPADPAAPPSLVATFAAMAGKLSPEKLKELEKLLEGFDGATG